MQLNEDTRNKWAQALDKKDDTFNGLSRRDNITRMVENQARWCATNQATLLAESAVVSNQTGAAIDTWSPVLIKMVKRMAPQLVAMDFFGVQPLATPDGLIFAMRVRYTGQTGAEAFYLSLIHI